jgi:K+/H+ antiporter YhaU regulatory subunit KhtT
LKTLMHGFELEARSGDIPVDYNELRKPRVIDQTLDSLQMRERSGASVLVVLREGQALINPEPGLVLRLVHQSTTPFTGAVI